MVDWSRVRTVITNMCAAFAAPVVFKSFQLTWHMEGFSKALPRTRYVWVRRPPLDTAMSIMRLREGFAGSRDAWVSMKPGAYETLVDQPRADQVAGQVHELESEIATLAGTVPSDAVLELPYERLCADPAGVLDDCAALLGAGGHTPAIVGAPPAGFSPSPLDTTDPDYHAVQAAIARRYS